MSKRSRQPATRLQEPVASTPPAGRIPLFDILRGVAIVLMASYHFCFDLNYDGFAQFDFHHDPFWLGSRTLILSLFLGLAGISLVLATAQGFNPRRFFRRLAWLAACAVTVSLASRMLFPDSWIFFGVLHFFFVASLLGLAFVRLYWANLGLGSLLVLAGVMQHPFFDQPWLQWVGLMTHKPITEDYVPLLPWFGVVLIGMFLGKLFLRSSWDKRLPDWCGDHISARVLALAGRHSLLIYMAHQPVLLGLLGLLYSL
jgi:uncharacterized membrane protein